VLGNFAKSIGASRAVLALSIARMADAMGNSILFIIIPLYVAKLPAILFHLPVPVQVGILISLYGFVNAFLQPIMGAFSDRIGRRKILIQAGLFLIGGSTLAFVLARNFFDLLLLRAFQGVAVAITIPASMAIMATITHRETRGGSMGIYSTLRVVGFSIGPLIGGFLKVHYGFNAAFYAGAGLTLLAMILVQIWVSDVRIPKEEIKKRPFRIIDRSLLSPGIFSAALATFLMAGAFSMVSALENEFNARLSINALGFGVAFSSLMVGRLLFQVPLGHLSDRVGRRPIILIGLLFTAPAIVLLGEIHTLTQFILLRLFQGITAAAIAAPAFAVAADLSRAGGEGRQMSVITMGFGLGIATGPLIAGLLSVVFFELPFLAIGALTLVGLWLVYRYLPETVSKEPQPPQ